ncbi:MAG: hypothetical protein D0531_04420 [Methylococcales bacterium]|nr:MAG: hypothetical protein D0531_04420 [Methylococcales bacterium]
MTELLGNLSPLQIICFPPVLNLMTLARIPFAYVLELAHDLNQLSLIKHASSKELIEFSK